MAGLRNQLRKVRIFHEGPYFIALTLGEGLVFETRRVGSIPTRVAIQCYHRLMVRTLDFHSGNGSSILPGSTNYASQWLLQARSKLDPVRGSIPRGVPVIGIF